MKVARRASPKSARQVWACWVLARPKLGRPVWACWVWAQRAQTQQVQTLGRNMVTIPSLRAPRRG